MGLFFTFEGLDGSGKTTQIGLLKRMRGDENFVFTKEPNNTKLWEIAMALPEGRKQIRTISAARIVHCKKYIIPKLSLGYNVICDRFIDSTYAYQAAVYDSMHKGYTLERLLNAGSVDVPAYPDCTFLLDVSYKKAVERKPEVQSQFSIDTFNIIRNKYLSLAHKYRRFKVFKENESPESINQQIMETIHEQRSKRADHFWKIAR